MNMHPKFEHDICVLTYTKILCGVCLCVNLTLIGPSKLTVQTHNKNIYFMNVRKGTSTPVLTCKCI